MFLCSLSVFIPNFVFGLLCFFHPCLTPLLLMMFKVGQGFQMKSNLCFCNDSLRGITLEKNIYIYRQNFPAQRSTKASFFLLNPTRLVSMKALISRVINLTRNKLRPQSQNLGWVIWRIISPSIKRKQGSNTCLHSITP